MKKLNLLNSLIFVLALQSSVSMMAMTREQFRQELIASYNAYKNGGKNKQELIAKLDAMIKEVEGVTDLGAQELIFAQLNKDLGVDVLQLRNSLKPSYFTKKNVAIATAATLIAGYEAFKAYQAFTKPESLKSVATREYFKTFGKKLAELHKQDLSKATAFVKGLGTAINDRMYSRRAQWGNFGKVAAIENNYNQAVNLGESMSELGEFVRENPISFDGSIVPVTRNTEWQVAQPVKPSMFSRASSALSNLKNAATSKLANAAQVVSNSSKNALEKVGTAGSKLYRRINPIKPVNDTSFSPVGITDIEHGIVSRADEAYALSQVRFSEDLTPRELDIISRVNNAEALSQLGNVASDMSDLAQREAVEQLRDQLVGFTW